MILTDGVGATALKQNSDSGRRNSNLDKPGSSSKEKRTEKTVGESIRTGCIIKYNKLL